MTVSVSMGDPLPGEFTSALWAAMERVIAHLHGEVSTYPPAIPGGRYQRTGRLRRSIQQRIEMVGGGSVEGRVYSTLYYAPYVIGPQQRQAIRQRGWRSVGEILEDNLDYIVSEFEGAVVEVIS